MRTFARLLLAPLFFAPAVLLAGPVTAYEALISVGRQKGNAYLDNMIEMRAVEGAPQPDQWTAIFRDASARGGLREFVVNSKGVASERTPLRAEDALLVAPAMPYAQLKMDSKGAFTEANKIATRARLGFDSVSYRLHSRNGAPVWTLRLLDSGRREVASLALSAKTGAVVTPLATSSGPSTTTAATAPADGRPLGERWAEGGGLVGHMTRWSERTWDATTNTANNVTRSMETFFVGKPTNAPVTPR
ncbi:MAG: hypothetical protein RIQ71_309 [Verrucomicrobiota bacterium]|jgi:hypothetical protein